MDLLYRFLLYIHILSVIMSIGPFFILFPIIKKLREAKDEVQTVLLDSFRVAVRLTKHAGHLLVGSGILLVIFSGWTWKTSWIVITILIMVSSLFFLARAFSPLLRKFTDSKQDREMLTKKLMRTTLAYLFLLLIMLWFMVAKPALW
ncbi:DUF2269 family protein [Bacillus sp. EB600]|uniref:DUF2269 family protein n=1 Tax=Bacillus sp. EB600 TaxID=2806345 RepID=UPI00210B3CDF|nr:DUF2269 family protein [Bacillus sp. EB600]MCQ6280292.1 DUF2269 family protein [Bacillus sp. EB600]